jgi:hypothetical protein
VQGFDRSADLLAENSRELQAFVCPNSLLPRKMFLVTYGFGALEEILIDL